MIRSINLIALALASTAAVAQPTGTSQALERNFDALISTADQLAWLKLMASEPNHVGSPHDKANAELSWPCSSPGAGTRISRPSRCSTRRRSRPRSSWSRPAARRRSAGRSRRSPATRARRIPPDALPAYVAYQGDGDVTAPLVYVNYGMPDDYEALEQRGIGVKGKIVIARYGGGWRGLKPKLAQEHGAVGCIIYSDPADDGYADGDVYPNGAARPPQRRPARLGGRHAALSGRPADARRRRDRGRQAADPRGGADDPEDPGPADLLCRRPSPAGARRPGGRRPAGAAGCRSPITGAAPTRSRSTSRSSPTGR